MLGTLYKRLKSACSGKPLTKYISFLDNMVLLLAGCNLMVTRDDWNRRLCLTGASFVIFGRLFHDDEDNNPSHNERQETSPAEQAIAPCRTHSEMEEDFCEEIPDTLRKLLTSGCLGPRHNDDEDNNPSHNKRQKTSPDDEDINPSHNKRQKTSPAADLICPILLELPWDPVTAQDGRVYERSAIEEHFRTHAGNSLRSPVTNEQMGKKLLPAPQHKNLIFTCIENGELDKELVSSWNKKVEQQKAEESLITKELLKKVKSGDGYAMWQVGTRYCSGTRGFPEDSKMALAWFKKAHAAGNVLGTAALGECLCKGFGGETCYKRGIMCISTAAGQGSNLAASTLGMALADGHYEMAVDTTEAIRWLEKCLDDNCPYQHLKTDAKNRARQRLGELKTVDS